MKDDRLGGKSDDGLSDHEQIKTVLNGRSQTADRQVCGESRGLALAPKVREEGDAGWNPGRCGERGGGRDCEWDGQ